MKENHKQKTATDAEESVPSGVELSPQLANVVAVAQRLLHMPDAEPFLVVLGAAAANIMPGAPVWLMVVGPPSGGKTVLLMPLDSMDHVFAVATLTEAALLSGTAATEVTADATGGLLKEMGAGGIILIKDFTSILSMQRDTRQAILAAFRELHDGKWTRRLGVDGGKTLSWEGKLGIIAACTEVIDMHHGVMAAMGERFVMYRLRPDEAHDEARTRQAIDRAGTEIATQDELSDAVARFVASLVLPETTIDLSDHDK